MRLESSCTLVIKEQAAAHRVPNKFVLESTDRYHVRELLICYCYGTAWYPGASGNHGPFVLWDDNLIAL